MFRDVDLITFLGYSKINVKKNAFGNKEHTSNEKMGEKIKKSCECFKIHAFVFYSIIMTSGQNVYRLIPVRSVVQVLQKSK